MNKTDVNRAVGPLMSAAQAGLVLMGTLSDEQSPWDSFKDSVRELATDKVAAAIAAGAFDEADEGQHNRLNGGQGPRWPCCDASLHCGLHSMSCMAIAAGEREGEGQWGMGVGGCGGAI